MYAWFYAVMDYIVALSCLFWFGSMTCIIFTWVLHHAFLMIWNGSSSIDFKMFDSFTLLWILECGSLPTELSRAHPTCSLLADRRAFIDLEHWGGLALVADVS